MAENYLTNNSKMPFGKHSGKKMIDVPAEYLIYLYNNGLEAGSLKSYIEEWREELEQEIKDNLKK